MTSGKRILLGVSGSVAVVKAPALARLFIEKGWTVDCVLTPAAARFVTPLAFAALTGRRAWCDLFADASYEMPHIGLAKTADAFVIAPASASTIARCAQGLGDDWVSLSYLATQAPVVIAPAMHDTMWLHAATRANVDTLRSRDVSFVGPVEGRLAGRDAAIGRMAEPDAIAAQVESLFS